MGKYLLPVVGPITQRFGENAASYRVFGLAGHNGVDFGVLEGTPVKATAAGLVVRACMDGSGYGNHVRIEHGEDRLSLYAHLSQLKVKVGQDVKRGHVIGLSGNPGNSTGPHLHFELRLPGGPEGFGGAVDPLPLLEAEPGASILYRVRVAARAGVYLRNQPGLNGEIVGGAGYDSLLDVYEEKNSWVRVSPTLEIWACVQQANNFLLMKEIEKPVSWASALDAWARGMGYTGPKP